MNSDAMENASDIRLDRIRAKARELWETAGRPDGRADDHWSEAERLIDAEDREDAQLRRRGPGVDIAPAAEGNSLGDIRPAMPGGRGTV
jgi:hypothetical protein